jgi:hypothetical protein
MSYKRKRVRIEDALERLREAESFYGSIVVVTEPFMDDGRRRWLASVREILLANGIEIENLSVAYQARSWKGRINEFTQDRAHPGPNQMPLPFRWPNQPRRSGAGVSAVVDRLFTVGSRRVADGGCGGRGAGR